MSPDVSLLAALQIIPALIGLGVALWLIGGWIRSICDSIDRNMRNIGRAAELRRMRRNVEGRRAMDRAFRQERPQ